MLAGSGLQFLNVYLSRLLGFRPRGPLFLYLEITRRCNLRCRFCNIWMVRDRNPELLRQELSTGEIMGIIRDAKRMGVRLVDIDGGEPLLRDDVYRIIHEICRLGMSPLLVTNGTLITKEVAARLVDSGLRTALISLDAPEPERHDRIRGVKGAFGKTLNGITNLREADNGSIRIGINSLVTTENMNLVEMAKLARNLGAEQIRFLPYHLIYPHNIYSMQEKSLFINRPSDIKKLEDEVEGLISFARKTGININSSRYLRGMTDYFRGRSFIRKCYAGYLFCDINCYGEVMPCLGINSMETVKKSSFRDIWNSRTLDDIRRDVRGRLCRNCWHSCYIEPNMRASPVHVIKNMRNLSREIGYYVGG